MTFEELLEKANLVNSEKDAQKLIKKLRKYDNAAMMLCNIADNMIEHSHYERGMMILHELYNSKYVKYYDEVTVWLRMAQRCFDKGEIDEGKQYLIRLCNEYENYEESFEFRGLTPVWNKYKHYVDGLVPKSKNLGEQERELTDSELLELLLEEVNSGGFDAYLSYNGEHFARTYAIVRNSDMPLTLDVLDRVKSKFPDGRIPETEDEISDVIDESELDFDDEDDFFCNTAVKEFV